MNVGVPYTTMFDSLLQIVENAVMEPKNEEERQAVYDKMMTPVPVKGLDPDTPRHIIALPQGRENAEGSWIMQNLLITISLSYIKRSRVSSP